MKIIKSGVLDKNEDIQRLYVFHDLAFHKKGTNTKFANSRTYYFDKEEQFYKHHEMLQYDLETIGIKNELASLDHEGKLKQEQLELAKAKRSELKSVKSFAPNSNKNSDLIEFHDEVIELQN